MLSAFNKVLKTGKTFNMLNMLNVLGKSRAKKVHFLGQHLICLTVPLFYALLEKTLKTEEMLNMLNVFKGFSRKNGQNAKMLDMLNILNVWGKMWAKIDHFPGQHLTYLTFPGF